jgi:hypothetical protein
MGVHFLDAELPRWDEAEAEALLLTFFADERPLRGAAGLADWRLCGRLSGLIKEERIAGKRGEVLMLPPPRRRVPFSRIILFGLGTSGKFTDDVYRQHVRWIRDVCARAKLRRVALQPPGRATGLIGARRAIELWLDEADKDDREEDLTVIDSHGAHKEMAEILKQRSRPEKA